MSKISFKKNLTKDAANPYTLETLNERLRKNKTIDYRNNYRIKKLDNDYVKIIPIDKTKLWK